VLPQRFRACRRAAAAHMLPSLLSPYLLLLSILAIILFQRREQDLPARRRGRRGKGKLVLHRFFRLLFSTRERQHIETFYMHAKVG